MNTFSNIDNKICNICDNEYELFFKLPNVVGIGFGYKITNGFYLNKKCIKVFVSKKYPSSLLSDNCIIPSLYKDIETDVIESGIFELFSLKNKIRPVPCGYSIGPSLPFSTLPFNGSMTCLVRDAHNYYILSCNHVIAALNLMHIGTSIIQPAQIDGGSLPQDTIATLARYIPLKPKTLFHTPANYMDCALAKVNNISLVSNKMALLGAIKNIIPASIDQSIRTVGRSSGVTYGYVTTTHASLNINFLKTKLLFKDQVLATNIATPGDSGAIVVDLNNNVVGMIIGGTTSGVSIFTPIQTVLNSLHVQIVNG